MMKVFLGCTRIVVVYKNKAYKIARIRPIKTLLKLAAALASKEHRQLLCDRYDKQPLRAIGKYLFAGWYCNSAEYRYWHQTGDSRCLPVIGSRFYGLVILQPKAETVAADRINCSRLVKLFHSQDIEITREEQYGLYDNRVVLLDYSHWKLPFIHLRPLSQVP